MNKHSYLSTRLYLKNIKMYTVDKQYKNRHHIGLNAGNMNVHELFDLICVILMFRFLTFDIDLSVFKHFNGLK